MGNAIPQVFQAVDIPVFSSSFLVAVGCLQNLGAILAIAADSKGC